MMDVMLEELKARRRVEGEERPSAEDAPREEEPRRGNEGTGIVLPKVPRGVTDGKGVGSGRGKAVLDGGETTNIGIDNVAHRLVREQDLARLFGRHGAIGSVKILWPRNEDDRSRPTSRAFANFIDPADARVAMDALQGAEVAGHRLRLTWARPCPKPQQPFYVPPHLCERVVRQLRRLHGEVRIVRVPADLPASLRELVDALSKAVAKHGTQLEVAVRAREQDNPHFGFLWERHNEPAHIYYKWRVYSLLQGDTLELWRDEPFQMFMSGPIWLPPPCPAKATASPAQSQVTDAPAAGALSEPERSALFQMLRQLTTAARSIEEVMVWVIERAHACTEISDVLAESLSLGETPAPAKAARLYLVSDVLYNTQSRAPGAAQYRQALEARLPGVFRSFAAVPPTTRPAVLWAVRRVLRVWDRWGLFSDDYLDNLADLAGLPQA